MTLAIIDYGSGNLRSVAKAFEHVAGGEKILVTSDAKEVVAASRIVLPGVGAFGDCMKGLAALSGMVETLHEQVMQKKKNFLGICVGMQLMFERGLEHGTHEGLGWLKGEVVHLNHQLSTINHQLKIPHMGWNALDLKRDHPILRGVGGGAHVYFVHSYHAKANAADILATTGYGGDVTAMVGRDNMVGTQFHPEKSQASGLAILQNFLSM
ncbi:MAG: imidazole glycerol phosphate synthase subunit HisH [Alphaproteobacteria bacterium]|nr:imidazole glycerol phosphate synthase subunit HisH [Alphaproteobacteria bacterium]